MIVLDTNLFCCSLLKQFIRLFKYKTSLVKFLVKIVFLCYVINLCYDVSFTVTYCINNKKNIFLVKCESPFLFTKMLCVKKILKSEICFVGI